MSQVSDVRSFQLLSSCQNNPIKKLVLIVNNACEQDQLK